jgi:hypothetical protein
MILIFICIVMELKTPLELLHEILQDFFTLLLMLIPTTAMFLQQDFATGHSSANTQDTLCNSNQSNPLISNTF